MIDINRKTPQIDDPVIVIVIVIKSKDSKSIFESITVHQTIPEACRACSNHPSNGGSGICNCILGTPQVKC